MDAIEWQAVPCKLWTGYTDNGYGRTSVNGRRVLVHRQAWIDANGPIPDGLDIGHLCEVRACYELAHLRPMTRAENNAYGSRVARIAAAMAEPWRRARASEGGTEGSRRRWGRSG